MPARRQTQEQYLAGLHWRIKDATEALKAAVSMRDWRGAKKYIAQIERFERQEVKSTGMGDKRRRRDPIMHSSGVAGNRYGRGRLP